MKRTFPTHLRAAAFAALSLAFLDGCDHDKRYVHVVFDRMDLATDPAGEGVVTDPQLVNPMGLQLSPGTNFWAANNGPGTVTAYQRDGLPLPAGAPLAVKLPVPGTL